MDIVEFVHLCVDLFLYVEVAKQLYMQISDMNDFFSTHPVVEEVTKSDGVEEVTTKKKSEPANIVSQPQSVRAPPPPQDASQPIVDTPVPVTSHHPTAGIQTPVWSESQKAPTTPPFASPGSRLFHSPQAADAFQYSPQAADAMQSVRSSPESIAASSIFISDMHCPSKSLAAVVMWSPARRAAQRVEAEKSTAILF